MVFPAVLQHSHHDSICPRCNHDNRISLYQSVRLTPPYLCMILIWSRLLYHVWDGPTWPANSEQTFDTKCESGWYLSLLYINNVVEPRREVSEFLESLWIYR